MRRHTTRPPDTPSPGTARAGSLNHTQRRAAVRGSPRNIKLGGKTGQIPPSAAGERGRRRSKTEDVTISILIIRPVRAGRDELFDLAEHIAEGSNTFGAASGFGRWGTSGFGRIVRESGRRIVYMLKDKN